MVNRTLQLTARDRSLLEVLSWTPVTAAQALAVSVTFAEPFAEERRVRERLQELVAAGLVRVATLHACIGSPNVYRLSPDGHRLLHGPDVPLPPRAVFEATPNARGPHTHALAAAIVHCRIAAWQRRITIARFFRENALAIVVGDRRVQPDAMFQFQFAGVERAVLFEIDLGSETVDSVSYKSIRDKIITYEAYADVVIAQWRRTGRVGPRPHFRVVFLTPTATRAYHILTLARDLAGNRDRHLVLAGVQDEFLASTDALREPLLIDHDGRFTALVDAHPTSRSLRTPVRLAASFHLEPAPRVS